MAIISSTSLTQFMETLKNKPTVSLKSLKSVMINVIETLSSYEEQLEKHTISRNELNKVIPDTSYRGIPITLEAVSNFEIMKYDIVGVFVGGSLHPSIVINVFKEDNCCVVFPITHNSTWRFSIPLQSRLFNASYLLLNPIEVSLTDAKKSFIGIYDDKKEIDRVIKFSKEMMKELIYK